MQSIFSKIVFALLSKLFFEDWPFFVEQQGPHFLITVKCWGENTVISVFSPSLFEEKFSFQ
jgi:hypothetical protein